MGTPVITTPHDSLCSLLPCILVLCALLSLSCSGGGGAADLFSRGMAEYARENLDAADELFRAAADADPGMAGAPLMRAKIRYYRKDFSGALRLLDRVTGEHEHHADALYWTARALMADPDQTVAGDREDRAAQHLRRALESSSGHIQARSLLALICEKRGTFSEAVRHYRTALREQESLVHARAGLALLYHRMGLNDRAAEEIRVARAICAAAGISPSSIEIIQREMKQ